MSIFRKGDSMKCPYAVSKILFIKTGMEYNTEGNQTSYTEYQKNAAYFLKCEQENCGAWHDGRCHYKD